MTRLSDTIVALATPVGTAALAVVRVSGPLSGELFRTLFGVSPTPRRTRHADYRSLSGELLDDILAVYFGGPRSYTGENGLELSCHGNPLIAQKIVEDLLARGCRQAEPGEFTRRAFLNGRLDLSQAEAVIDLIHARSERALAAANQQLRGSLGRHLHELTEALLGVLARVEAYIDFPDEDLPAEDRSVVRSALEGVRSGTDRLLATQRYGDLLRDGIRTVIVGEPNAGKSSLLNRLVGRERALVSPEPGTTRDYLEEKITLGVHSIRLIDTAGLNLTPAPLERRGIEKTLERAAEADLFLLVLDALRPVPPLPEDVRRRLGAATTIVIWNKMDAAPWSEPPAGLPSPTVIPFSALTGKGYEALVDAILEKAEAFRQEQGAEIIAINARHADALRRARVCLDGAAAHLEGNGPVELLASELRGALDAFGEIGGRIDNERMLDHLFASFCIGK